eukprot:COSAG03_NODE_832_length_5683_cov_10.516112_3_plen_139_part_00
MAMTTPRSHGSPRGSPRASATGSARNSGFLLREAAGAGNLDAVEKQLSGLDGVDVDDAGSTRRTALHCAAQRGRGEVVRLLLGQGASVNAQSTNGDAPLHLAAQDRKNGATVASELIKAGANVSLPNGMGWTALHCAM